MSPFSTCVLPTVTVFTLTYWTGKWCLHSRLFCNNSLQYFQISFSSQDFKLPQYVTKSIPCKSNYVVGDTGVRQNLRLLVGCRLVIFQCKHIDLRHDCAWANPNVRTARQRPACGWGDCQKIHMTFVFYIVWCPRFGNVLAHVPTLFPLPTTPEQCYIAIQY